MHTSAMTANPEEPRDLHADSPTQRRRPIPADTLMVRLAIARMHAGHLTIREAADRCGLNYASWSNWEQGSRPRDLLGVTHAISEGLDIDHDWLLFGGRLAGARGMPTIRATEVNKGYPPIGQTADGDNRGYPNVNLRPLDTRPSGRPGTHKDRPTTGPVPRRPVRISRPQAA